MPEALGVDQADEPLPLRAERVPCQASARSRGDTGALDVGEAHARPYNATISSVTEELRQVERLALDAQDSGVGLLREAGRYAARSGGERMRPAVRPLASHAPGGDARETAVRAAAAIALLYGASLVQEDIADRSGLRRGQPSANNRWGSDLALRIGDLTQAVAGLDGRAASVLADPCAAVVGGETRQICPPASPAESVLQVLHEPGAVAGAIGGGEECLRAAACLSSLPGLPARGDLAALARYAVIR